MSTVGIVGLGLIGGSMAKAYAQAGWTVLGDDRDRVMLDFARMSGDVHGLLDAETVKTCDLLLLAIPPQAAVEDLRKRAPDLAPSTLVIDLCGTKRVVCEALFPLAQQYGFTYVGGHPMAGREFSGFDYAKDDLFENASMILVPAPGTDVATVQMAKDFFLSLGFGRVRFSTPQEHDEMIALTSQLAHIVSSAYVKSPLAARHKGFSAGSFLDMTRVARLNEDMWTELFFDNADMLSQELGGIIERLEGYKLALDTRATVTMKQLLREGREAKEALDE